MADGRPVELPSGADLRAETAALLQRLIAAHTVNPPGDEAQAAAVIEEHVRGSGLRCRRIAKNADRPNLLVTLPGTGDGPTLAFLGHLDVVPVRREDWSVEPFGGIERDGWIWGRGAVDMKGQVAATTVALTALARAGFRPRGDIMLLLMADEEVAEAGVGSDHVVEALPDLRVDYVVGEGSGERYDTTEGPVYLLDHGVKGSSTVTLTVQGRAGDASLPDAGQSAVFGLAELLTRLREWRAPVRIHEALGPVLHALGGAEGDDEQRLARARATDPQLSRILGALTGSVIRPTIIEVPGPPNAVADRAIVTLEAAVVPGTTEEELEAELRDAFGDDVDYTLEIVPIQGGTTSPTGTPLHDAIAGFLAERDPEARLVPCLGYGYSDCDKMRKAYGSVAYGFIPFRHADPQVNLDTKHGPDERVLIDDLLFQTQAALHVAQAIGDASAQA